MKLVYKYEAYPTMEQKRQLSNAMMLLRELMNAAIWERQDAYKWHHKIPTVLKNQMHQVKDVKTLRLEFKELHTDWTEDAIDRVDKRFKQFFQHRKEKSHQDKHIEFFKFNHSLAYTRSRSFSVEWDGKHKVARLHGKKIIGAIKFKLHRPLPSVPTMCSISVDKGGRWFLCFTVEKECLSAQPVREVVGMDVGIKNTVATSTGEIASIPKIIQRKIERRIWKLSRRLARRKLHSKGWYAARRALARFHDYALRFREGWIHTLTARLSEYYVVREELNLLGLKRGMLSAQFQHIPIGKIFSQLEYKTKLQGTKCDAVPCAGTSQECVCGASVPKKLSQRVHRCPVCGLTGDRDVVSAVVVKGRSDLAGVNPSGPCKEGWPANQPKRITQTSPVLQRPEGLRKSMFDSSVQVVDLTYDSKAVAGTG